MMDLKTWLEGQALLPSDDEFRVTLMAWAKRAYEVTKGVHGVEPYSEDMLRNAWVRLNSGQHRHFDVTVDHIVLALGKLGKYTDDPDAVEALIREGRRLRSIVWSLSRGERSKFVLPIAASAMTPDNYTYAFNRDRFDSKHHLDISKKKQLMKVYKYVKPRLAGDPLLTALESDSFLDPVTWYAALDALEEKDVRTDGLRKVIKSVFAQEPTRQDGDVRWESVDNWYTHHLKKGVKHFGHGVQPGAVTPSAPISRDPVFRQGGGPMISGKNPMAAQMTTELDALHDRMLDSSEIDPADMRVFIGYMVRYFALLLFPLRDEHGSTAAWPHGVYASLTELEDTLPEDPGNNFRQKFFFSRLDTAMRLIKRWLQTAPSQPNADAFADAVAYMQRALFLFNDLLGHFRDKYRYVAGERRVRRRLADRQERRMNRGLAAQEGFVLKSFKIWLEERIDPDRMRDIVVDYLGLREMIDPKEGLAIPLDQLNVEEIRQKLGSWSLFQQLGDSQKDAAMQVLNKPNASLGDLVDAIASGPAF